MNIITPFKRTQLELPIPEKMEKFKNLLYVPLDLPEPPKIDLDEMLEWSRTIPDDHPNQAGEIKTKNGVILTPERAIKNKLGYYPWLSIWLKRNPDFVPQNDGWMMEFKEKYPELADYVMQFPLKETVAVNLMWQKEGHSVMIHTDPEHWFGMRLYLSNTPNSPLFFMKTKEPVEKRYDYVTTDINDEHLSKIANTTKHYVKFLKPCHPWIINNVRALHGVDTYPNATGTRAVIVIHGRFKENESPIDFDKLYDLLERSVDKYQEYAIWY